MSTSLASTLASRVRQERLRLGLTQAETATRAGFSARSYQRFEHIGFITLRGLEGVLAALGLTLALTSADTGTAPTVDPRLSRVRRRGLRRAPAATPSSPPESAPVTAASPAPRVRRPLPLKRPDPGRVAAMADEHRQRIMLLVRTIVSSHLTNYTAHQVVENTMNSANLADSDRPAFSGAVAGQLNGLTAESIQAFGISPADFERWARDWDPSLGIVDAFAAAAGGA